MPVQLGKSAVGAACVMCLEPISRNPSPDGTAVWPTPMRTRHAPGETLNRHRHDGAFAAIVVSGNYVEAGDTGRHRLGPGDVVFHVPFESHLDRFDRSNTEVLNLPLPARMKLPVVGTLSDPDSIVRLAEHDAPAAIMALQTSVTERMEPAEDWPDALATELLRDPDTNLTHWAVQSGLHPGSLSRGFRQQFGVTPAKFRTIVRIHSAIRRLAELSLSEAALESGFADQAHMTRAARQMTGLPPGRIKRLFA